ncbi:hypothetical protein [Bacillus xiapuensis]|uniref:Uncharacterized protein n=1 Tax=Bacillus xiapuensis TaxID=2014075 RepID=A0ABU6NC75_9BACI|nr:hypothetical protein [Bacillus xiapuensis]
MTKLEKWFNDNNKPSSKKIERTISVLEDLIEEYPSTDEINLNVVNEIVASIKQLIYYIKEDQYEKRKRKEKF